MLRLASERLLLIGDTRRELQRALAEAAPGARLTSVETLFDGIAELAAEPDDPYTTVIAAAEPIERRPEAAVRELRKLAPDSRLLLFGHAGHEVLSRKMLQVGCDDYLVLPADPAEVKQVLGTPAIRREPSTADAQPASDGEDTRDPYPSATPGELADVLEIDEPTTEDRVIESFGVATCDPAETRAAFARIPLAEILLDALLKQPNNPLPAALAQVNVYLAPCLEVTYRPAGRQPQSAERPEFYMLSHDLPAGDGAAAGKGGGALDLLVSEDQDPAAAQEGLAHLAALLGRLEALHDRHARLQRLAITDELTGVYNARYFRHFLTRILDRARQMHFPVTLLLFDIDDFKRYNDQFGHCVGDEILKQTAAMMKRCTREHDLVARIGGDEFAVVFWDKEGPRQPREPRPGPGNPSRPPQSPQQIFQRFKAMIASDQFTALGPSGKGVLGISAGLVVYPYDAPDAASLIREADRALMMGAKKRTGKDSLYIVGTDDPTFPPPGAPTPGA
jgi:GGDEF domain-containing protein/DNA-binding response OmpR family regulator